MSVRPISFSCNVITDAPEWTPNYESVEYRNLIVSQYGSRADFCHVCLSGGFLSQTTRLVAWTFVWDGDATPTAHSERVCERHATDAWENFCAIGK